MKKTISLVCLFLGILFGTTGFFVFNPISPQITNSLETSNLYYCQTGYIEVRVYDSDSSNPIQGVIVKIWQNSVQMAPTEYTDSNGFANITGLDVGWYNVTVEKNAYYGQMKSDYINWDGDDDYLYFYIIAMPEGSGYIEITVWNEGGTSKLSGVSVAVRNDTGLIDTGLTDVNGFYNATGLYVGWHYITVSKAGYIPQTKNDYINWNGDDDYLTFYLVEYPPGSGYIEVTVLNNENALIPNAYVNVKNQSTGVTVISGYTDAYGFFNATGLYIGWHDVIVSKHGYYTQTKTNYINWNGDDDYLTFHLEMVPENTGYIEVTVKDTGGTPINQAYVYVINQETGLTHVTGLTNPSGFFNVTGLTSETWYQVIIQKSGYEQQSKTDYINWRGDDDYLTFYLDTIDPNSQSLKVYVKRATNPGISVGNAKVEIWQNGVKIKEGSTGNWGYYQADQLNNQTPITIVASAPGFNTSTVTNIDLQTLGFPIAEFTIYLMPLTGLTGYIEVIVRDGYNSSIRIAGATVTVTYPNSTTFVLGNTDANGFFNITGLDVGWHLVAISAAGYLDKSGNDYISWQGDDDYLNFYLSRISFTSQSLTLQQITPNPDPTGDIDLYWNDVIHELGYKIYRGNSLGTLELIATLGADTTSYKDVGVPEGAKDENGNVYYQIIAYNESANIGSNIESVQIYSHGGDIPGFEFLFIALTLIFLIVLVRRYKTKNNSFF